MTTASTALVLLLALAGCPADDTASAEGDFVFATEPDARLALATVDLPYLIAFTITPTADTPTTCPVTTRVPGGWRSEGGCTDAAGTTYEGSVAVQQNPSGDGVAYTFDYDRFGATAASWSLHVDGRITASARPSDCGFAGPSPLETDGLHVTIGGQAVEGFGGFFPGDGQTTSLTFDHYRFAWDLKCDPATVTAHGTIGVDGRGSFALDATRAEVDGCSERDALAGTATFQGSNLLELEYDGASTCDACVPYQSDDGMASGRLCWN
jgi:hypothetical protein